MKLLRDTSIRVKVLIPPAILALALGLVSLLAIYGMDKQRAALSEVNDIALDRITLIDEFVLLSEQVQSDVFRISVIRFMELPEEEIQPNNERLEQGLNDLDVIYGQILTKWPLDETERSILERMKEPMDAFRMQAVQAAAVVSDNPSFGILLVRSATVTFAEFRATLAEFLNYQQAKIVRAGIESDQRAIRLHTAIVAIAVLITLTGVSATVLISTRWISGPIHSMTDLMRRLAEGDLSTVVPDLERRDEIGAMAQAVEVFRNNAIEKAQAEEALRESESTLKAILEASPAGIGLTRDRTIQWCNTGMSRLTGYSKEYIAGKSTQYLYESEEEYERIGRELHSGIVEKGISEVEARVRHKDGGVIDCYLQARALDPSDVSKGIIGVLVDITERKRLEHEVEQRRLYLESVLTYAPDAIVTLDNQRRVQEWNEGAEKLFGYSSEEVIGRDLDKLVTGSDARIIEEAASLVALQDTGERF